MHAPNVNELNESIIIYPFGCFSVVSCCIVCCCCISSAASCAAMPFNANYDGDILFSFAFHFADFVVAVVSLVFVVLNTVFGGFPSLLVCGSHDTFNFALQLIT